MHNVLSYGCFPGQDELFGKIPVHGLVENLVDCVHNFLYNLIIRYKYRFANNRFVVKF